MLQEHMGKKILYFVSEHPAAAVGEHAHPTGPRGDSHALAALPCRPPDPAGDQSELSAE